MRENKYQEMKKEMGKLIRKFLYGDRFNATCEVGE
jgi:hypothetical protein